MIRLSLLLGQEFRLDPMMSSINDLSPCIVRVLVNGDVFILAREDFDHVEDAFLDGNEGCESVWEQMKLQYENFFYGVFL